MKEAELVKAILDFAAGHGWLVTHFRPGEMPGVWKPGVRVSGSYALEAKPIPATFICALCGGEFPQTASGRRRYCSDCVRVRQHHGALKKGEPAP